MSSERTFPSPSVVESSTKKDEDGTLYFSSGKDGAQQHASLAQRNIGGYATDTSGGHHLGAMARCFAPVKHVLYTAVPPGGVLSGAFNLASVSIGAGILGLPSATNSCGLLMALIYLLVVTAFSAYTTMLIGLVCEKTKLESFELNAQYLFPQWNYAFSYFATMVRLFHGFASCVAYVISVGNCLSPIFAGALRRHPDNKHLQFLASKNGNRFMTSMIWLGIMVPLVIPRHIDSLRYASTLAVSFMVYFVLAIIFHSCTHGLPEHSKNIITVGRPNVDYGDAIFLFRPGNTLVASIGVFFFVHVNQIAVYETTQSLDPSIRDAKHVTLTGIVAMSITGTLYAFVCIFGYLDFGQALEGKSILLMYDPLGEPAMMIGYIGVFVKLCVAFALLTLTVRNSAHYLLGWQHKYSARRLPAAATHTTGRALPTSRVMLQEHPRCSTVGDDVELCSVHAKVGGPTVGTPEPDALGSGSVAGFTSVSADPKDTILSPSPAADKARVTMGTREEEEVEGHAGVEGTGAGHKDTPIAVVEDVWPQSSTQADAGNYPQSSAVEDTSYIDNIPFWKHVTAVMVIATLCLICGLFIPKINTVLSFAGGFSGGCIAFLFPALFFMYAGNFSLHESGWFLYFGTYLSAFVGVVGIVWGTAGTIYDII